MANIQGHEVEIGINGETITVSGVGAKAIYDILQPVADASTELTKINNNSFSFNLNMLDSAFNHINKNEKAITIISEIYQDATPTLTCSMPITEPQHQNVKTNQVNR